jgi:hypothetical protein
MAKSLCLLVLTPYVVQFHNNSAPAKTRGSRMSGLEILCAGLHYSLHLWHSLSNVEGP